MILGSLIFLGILLLISVYKNGVVECNNISYIEIQISFNSVWVYKSIKKD